MNPYEGIEDLSRSHKSAAKAMYVALALLKEAGGDMSRKEIMHLIPERLKEHGQEFNSWDNERLEKTGYIRWRSNFQYFTIDLVKAGYLRKVKGVWYLTPEGEIATQMGAVALYKDARAKYKAWQKVANEEKSPQEEVAEDDAIVERNQTVELEELEELAREGIKSHIKALNAYEFQDLVAALLRAMGYFTPFISPKGKDGGIDIIAFQDPLGSKSPRIKVQVKHRPEASIAVDDIRGLTGLLNKDGDIGLFVTSGRFTSESERFSRDSHIHIKLIDGSTLIDLWMEFYSKLTDEDKNRLPLHQIYFLGTNG